MNQYRIDMPNPSDIEEIESVEPQLVCDDGASIMATRSKLIALSERLLGKAERVRHGEYGESGDDVDIDEWSDQLSRIANAILGHFKPGDGKY